MKKSYLALTIALLVSYGSISHAQTAVADPPADEKVDLPSGKEILAKSVDAMGGEDALRAFKSSKSTGKFEMAGAGITAPLTVFAAAPGQLAFELEIPGMGKMIKGTNGTIAWENSPMTGPRLLDGTELSSFLKEADSLADLSPDKYYKSIECKGMEEVGEKKCYQVEFTTKDDQVETKYYDPETYLLVQSEQVQDTPMGKIKVVSSPSDYREVDGMQIPHRVEQSMMGQTQVVILESLEMNIDVDESTFAIPEEIQELIDNEKKDEEKGDEEEEDAKDSK